MQFRDKTAYVWGLRYRWDPSLSRIPDPRIPHFMPPCFLLLLFLFLLLILVLFRLVKSNRRNEVPAKVLWKKGNERKGRTLNLGECHLLSSVSALVSSSWSFAMCWTSVSCSTTINCKILFTSHKEPKLSAAPPATIPKMHFRATNRIICNKLVRQLHHALLSGKCVQPAMTRFAL